MFHVKHLCPLFAAKTFARAGGLWEKLHTLALPVQDVHSRSPVQFPEWKLFREFVFCRRSLL
jgi:hypothetical protein